MHMRVAVGCPTKGPARPWTHTIPHSAPPGARRPSQQQWPCSQGLLCPRAPRARTPHASCVARLSLTCPHTRVHRTAHTYHRHGPSPSAAGAARALAGRASSGGAAPPKSRPHGRRRCPGPIPLPRQAPLGPCPPGAGSRSAAPQLEQPPAAMTNDRSCPQAHLGRRPPPALVGARRCGPLLRSRVPPQPGCNPPGRPQPCLPLALLLQACAARAPRLPPTDARRRFFRAGPAPSARPPPTPPYPQPHIPSARRAAGLWKGPLGAFGREF
jgi:hypothetical protein